MPPAVSAPPLPGRPWHKSCGFSDAREDRGTGRNETETLAENCGETQGRSNPGDTARCRDRTVGAGRLSAGLAPTSQGRRPRGAPDPQRTREVYLAAAPRGKGSRRPGPARAERIRRRAATARSRHSTAPLGAAASCRNPGPAAAGNGAAAPRFLPPPSGPPASGKGTASLGAGSGRGSRTWAATRHAAARGAPRRNGSVQRASSAAAGASPVQPGTRGKPSCEAVANPSLH